MLNFEEFRSELIKEAQKHITETTIIEEQGDIIRIISNGSAGVLYLANAWRNYQEGVSIENIAKQMITPILNPSSKNQSFDFEWDKVKNKILPMIKPKEFAYVDVSGLEGIAEIESDAIKTVHRSDIIPDMLVLYVIDYNDKMAYVYEQHMDMWQIDLETLHKTAINNLKRLSQPVPQRPHPKEVFLASATHDGYDATRILTLDYTYIKRYIKGDILIGIPNRDFIIVFDSKTEALNFYRMQILKDSINQQYPLTSNIYKWNGKRFKIFNPNEEEPKFFLSRN